VVPQRWFLKKAAGNAIPALTASVKVKKKRLRWEEHKYFSSEEVLYRISPIESITTPPFTIAVGIKGEWSKPNLPLSLGTTTSAEIKVYRLGPKDGLLKVDSYEVGSDGFIKGPIKGKDHYMRSITEEFLHKLRRLRRR
jgi:hypothetical protein